MRRNTLRLSRTTALSLALTLSSSVGGTTVALAQATKDGGLVGTYALVAVDNVSPDGSRTQLYGPHPKGILTFDAQGRYTLQIVRDGEPKFAVDDKSKGTDAEYKTAALDANSHFGQYSVDDVNHTITFNINAASFPNWNGTTQIRNFTLKGDLLTYVIPTPTSGTHVVGEDVWKRLP
jgi:Lipocalin-like domain